MAIFKIIFLILFSSSLFALQISPIRINLDKKNKISSIKIKNDLKKERTFQLKIYKWEISENGRYKLTKIKKNEMIIMPMIFTLKKNQLKVIKIGKLKISGNPENYRLYITDITKSTKKNYIAMKAENNLPVFVSQNDKKSNILMKVIKKKDTIVLNFTNNGQKHDSVFKIYGLTKEGKEEIVFSSYRYILPSGKIKLIMKNKNYNKVKVKFEYAKEQIHKI